MNLVTTTGKAFAGKVIIVDDDLMIRLMASAALLQAGFEVRMVNDGSQALKLLDEFVPDIILLDVLMPEMDGYTTCSALRALGKGADIPVLMMTGLDDLESIEKAYQAGATDFITKPIQWQILPHRVQYIIRSNQAYRDLKSSKLLLSQTQRLAGIGSWSWDVSNDQFIWSEELLHIFKISADQVDNTSQSFFRFIDQHEQEVFTTELTAAFKEMTPVRSDLKVRLFNGEELNIYIEATPEPTGADKLRSMRGVVQNITERKRTEEQISYLAYYDTLTRLPNRQLFKDRLAQALLHAERTEEKLAVLFIDLDDFKAINDTHGHRVGDLMLEDVARRLGQETRSGDTLARLGGDEFIIMLQDVKSAENAMLVARKHLENLLGNYQLEDKKLFISASIGIALFPEHGDSVDDLVKSADAAMYQAKEKGKKHIELFTQALFCKVSEKLSLQCDLRRALEHNEFILYYQPRINLLTGSWSGVEALVRWQHPERGMISPLTFIPIAEETGLIIELGERVLREACQQLQRWHLEGIRVPRISVNVSPLQFRCQNIVELVESAVKDAVLCTQALELEITESALMDDMEQSIIVLKQLQRLGVCRA